MRLWDERAATAKPRTAANLRPPDPRDDTVTRRALLRASHPDLPHMPHEPRTPRQLRAAYRQPADPGQPATGYHGRAAYIAGYTPRPDPSRPTQLLLPIARALVAAVPVTKPSVDKHRLAAVLAYLTWLNATRRTPLHPDTFDRSLLAEEHLAAWAARLRADDTNPKAAAQRIGHVRTVRDGQYLPAQQPTPRPTVAPHTAAERQLFYQAAHNLHRTTWASPALLLLDLIFGAGLRAFEVCHLTANAVTHDQHGTDITITDRRGNTRTIPVIGDTARRITAHAAAATSPHAYLLRPGFAVRQNTVNQLMQRLTAHDPVFTAFDAARARHTWLAGLMQQPIPALDVHYLAGINPGVNTLADLQAHLPRPTPDAIRARLTALTAAPAST